MGRFKKCCGGCTDGVIVTRLANLTQVHCAAGSATACLTNPEPPFTRGCDGSCCPGGCTGAGNCCGWYVNAGSPLGSLSTQEITDTVNDIMACGGGQTSVDHNCYGAGSPSTVNLSSRRFGGKWCVARKFWHGVFGIIDRDDPHIGTGVGSFDTTTGVWTNTYADTAPNYPTPPQIKYRTIIISTSCVATNYDSDGVTVSNVSNGSCSGTATVGQYTGILSKSGSETNNFPGSPSSTPDMSLFGNLMAWDNNALLGLMQTWSDVPSANSGETIAYVQLSPTSWELTDTPNPAGGGNPLNQTLILKTITISPGYVSETIYQPFQNPDGSWFTSKLFTQTINWGNDSITATSTQYTFGGGVSGTLPLSVVTIKGTLTLQDPYSASDWQQDAYNLHAAWDLSNANAYPWRTDEELALTPLIIYDEVQSETVPALTVPTINGGITMDDYTTATPGVGDGWNQIGWQDTNNYLWTFGTPPNMSVNYGPTNLPPGWAGNSGSDVAVLNTGLYTGQIISHNPAGSDPHFWFGFAESARVNCAGDLDCPDCGFEWNTVGYGDFTPGNLPFTAMRWLQKSEAQYDPDGCTTNQGMFPGAFIHQTGGMMYVGKFVQAAQKWNSVNYTLTNQWTLCLDCAGNITPTTDLTCSGTIPTLSPLPAGAAPQSTGVLLSWTFNCRAKLWASPPSGSGTFPAGWYAGLTDCTGCNVQQFSYAPPCAVIGVVPFYSPAPTGNTVPQGNQTPGLAGPVENFGSNQVMFSMPDTITVDYLNGSHWQAAIILTMPDPFYVLPTIPSCTSGPTVGNWQEDNGCGQANFQNHTSGQWTWYYPATPLVEAAMTPTGSLPSGVYLPMDPAHNTFLPPYYPTGIHIGNPTGDYGTVTMDWGFAMRACNSGNRFASYYSNFVYCSDVPAGGC